MSPPVFRFRTSTSPWAAVVALFGTLALAAAGASAVRPDSEEGAWLRVDYTRIVDRGRLTHGADTVGGLLDQLGGRPFPPSGERPADNLAHRLLEPHVEPYAFVMSDALDAVASAADPPLVDLGGLWEPGETEPAWVELLRARRFLIESDGKGKFRVFVPWPSGERVGASGDPPLVDAEAASREAWQAAWPVVRHVLAAERRRLATIVPSESPPALDIQVHAYRHLPARSLFDVTARPLSMRVEETGDGTAGARFDVAALTRQFGRPSRVEGGRLDPDGSVRWFASEAEAPPTILGRPVALADAAVAYRAVFHGGRAEPYMSLDRGDTPWDASVSFGGRLRDTSLGLVSLLCDVRFKTFSLGIDPFLGEDVREDLRRRHEGFRTHLERFAADPGSGDVATQQTRFWFYPDDVDLTLSSQGDVLAIRRVRMTAASERVDEATRDASGDPDPDWTRAMVAYINDRHDALATSFPEIGDLDESVRLIAIFSWLRAARDRGLEVPDLDVLLDVMLPAEPTPRRFPQLLTHNILPGPGATGVVDVLERAPVGEALDHLRPTGGRKLDPARRFARALAALDPRVPDQAAMAATMGGAPPSDPETLDALAYRAERLVMHHLVLGAVTEARREEVARRRADDPRLRVFSVGIGGIDLGLSKALARATGRSEGLLAQAVPSSRVAAPRAPADRARETRPPVPDPVSEATVPDHGLGVAKVERSFGGSWIRRESWRPESGSEVRWTETVLLADSPAVRVRRRVDDPTGRGSTYERFEDGRAFGYRFDREGSTLRAVPAAWPVPRAAIAADSASLSGAIPPSLATLTVMPSSGRGGESPRIAVRLRSGPRDVGAELPRGVLQRLVVGRGLDAAPDRPLPALSPARTVLGEASAMMVLGEPSLWSVPWDATTPTPAGEEDPARLAAALIAWWASEDAESSRVPVVVGTDATRSPARFVEAPALPSRPTIVIPGDAFPGARGPWRDAAIEACGGPETVASSLPPTPADLVVIVSAEAPGRLAKRVREIAGAPSMAGKHLAIVSIASPLRPDVPADLLRKGTIAGIGVAEIGAAGVEPALARVGRDLGALRAAPSGTRAGALDGPFLWYY